MRIRLFLIALAGSLLPTLAHADDASYCEALGALALRYMGSAGGNGGLAPDMTTLGALRDCRSGNTAAGIAVLEKKLRSAGFTLPPRN
ncbi:hypothetical protein SAMN02745126_06097 [Enhydrobacter aerosaccus]|uniref:Uncharacterized protein n=1 Tax=Enhydrobacter aerosaccus TaxID=225324 RepID=A0A1T4TE88_9HYPH|nr:hypothetical protein [Enhydrobacter aerosaccus]SKA38757.1 hypothetical protein SAMN02745126_06097 [Enhydrobacter aerosaccus]